MVRDKAITAAFVLAGALVPAGCGESELREETAEPTTPATATGTTPATPTEPATLTSSPTGAYAAGTGTGTDLHTGRSMPD